jgi:ankyrin repeat protein
MSDHEINHHIDRFKESFLFAAARGGRIEECASLISFGANVDWRENGKEDNPLLAAVRNSMQDVAALLLAHGANPTVRDRDGNTVMHLAAANGDEGMASLFSPNASDLSLSTNKHGMTGK